MQVKNEQKLPNQAIFFKKTFSFCDNNKNGIKTQNQVIKMKGTEKKIYRDEKRIYEEQIHQIGLF